MSTLEITIGDSAGSRGNTRLCGTCPATASFRRKCARKGGKKKHRRACGGFPPQTSILAGRDSPNYSRRAASSTIAKNAPMETHIPLKPRSVLCINARKGAVVFADIFVMKYPATRLTAKIAIFST